jgi:hypothetical protein
LFPPLSSSIKSRIMCLWELLFPLLNTSIKSRIICLWEVVNSCFLHCTPALRAR